MASRARGKKAAAGPATQAVHVGEKRHGVGGPVVTPIVQSATFTFESVGEMKRWAAGRSRADIYTRYSNPTLRVVEAKLAALEGGEGALVTASGMAAIASSLLTFLGAGDEVIATRQLYGGTYRLLRDIFPRLGIKVHHVGADLKGVAELVTPRTRVLYTETPTNPTLSIVDLRQAVALARRERPELDRKLGLVLTFFCAGTPSSETFAASA